MFADRLLVNTRFTVRLINGRICATCRAVPQTAFSRSVCRGSRCFRLCEAALRGLFVCAARGTADWFGVSKDGDATQRWQRKSLRHCSLRYGKLKPQVIREMDLPSQDNISLTSTETPPPLYVPSSQHGMQKVKAGGRPP